MDIVKKRQFKIYSIDGTKIRGSKTKNLRFNIDFPEISRDIQVFVTSK